MSAIRKYVVYTALFMGFLAVIFLYSPYIVGGDVSPVTGKFTGQLQFSVGDEVNSTNSSDGGTSGSSESSGGGGNGGNALPVEITMSTDLVQVSLLQGESKLETVTLTNNRAQQIVLNLDLKNASSFVSIDTSYLILEPGESKNISITFSASEDSVPSLYIGSLQISGPGIREQIILALEIQSSDALLDVGLEIPSRFLEISFGQDVVALIQIYNLGKTGKVDVTLEYFIKNIEDTVVFTRQEVVSVETQTSFVKNFELPSGLPSGKYVIYVRATYSGKVASASSWFKLVSPKDKSLLPWIIVAASFLAAIIIIVVIFTIKSRPIKSERKFKYRTRVV